MSAARKRLAFKDLDRLFRHGPLPSGDGALLECFLAGGDEAAFEAIVARHGSMVLGVCRRVLDDPHDADDAFQATFLVLVRKARHLRDADRLGPWLYGVATRVATKARAREVRRRGRYSAMSVDLPSSEVSGADWLDVRPILDAEMGRLPAKLRDTLVLCLLEGSTAEEAAQRLSCPLGTVKSRLARGREALRGRLTARGLAPATVVAVVTGSSRSAFASPVSKALSLATLRVAGLAPGHIPLAVVALSRGVAPSMLHKSSVLTAMVCGGVALAGAGLVTWSKSHATAAEPAAQAAQDNPDAARVVSTNHLKMILLAFYNYHNANYHFPPAAISGADGKPKLSWRVAILPYLDQEELYKEFHLNEPWNSPHNKALIARMPDVYKTPSSPTGEGKTRVRGFEGPGTMFDGKEGVNATTDVPDGTSNTIMIAVGREETPWTMPGDLAVTEGGPLPALDNIDVKGVLVGAADGSVHYVPGGNDILLRGLITRAGGEAIEWPPAVVLGKVPGDAGGEATAKPPGPAGAGTTPLNTTPTPAPTNTSTIPPELEQRLRGIEAKFDEILRRFDAAEQRAQKR